MSNIQVQVHNSYHYQLIDQSGKVLLEDTLYNTANSGVYVTSIGSGTTHSAPLTLHYKPYIGDGSLSENISTTGQSVIFHRETPSSSVAFGSDIVFKGSVDFSAGAFSGQVIQMSIGSNQNGAYWSEVSSGISKDEATKLHIDITLHFSVSAPSIIKVYDSSISSLLNADSDSFPTPGVKYIGISSLDVSLLNNVLTKRVPILSKLDTVREANIEQGTYTVKNPSTSSTQSGEMILGSSQKNYGAIQSLIYGDVGAEKLSSGLMNNNSSNEEITDGIYIPAAILDYQTLVTLVNANTTKYFFSVAPPGARKVSIVENGSTNQTSQYSWTDPKTLNNMRITAVGMVEGEEVPISNYRNTLTGQYYANYLFGNITDERAGYWEPPEGTPVCPRYLYLEGVPYNLRIGNNINAYIEAYVNGSWRKIISGIKYETVYMEPVEDAERYRLVVSAPSSEGTGYFVNAAEHLVVPDKAYDPYILCIGDESNDFGRAGIGISNGKLRQMLDRFSDDQDQVTGYNIGITILPSTFYKSTNTIGYLIYEARTSG